MRLLRTLHTGQQEPFPPLIIPGIAKNSLLPFIRKEAVSSLVKQAIYFALLKA